MNREQAIDALNLLWGADTNNKTVIKMLVAVIDELGYDAFSDNALVRLAELQRSENEAQSRRAERRTR